MPIHPPHTNKTRYTLTVCGPCDMTMRTLPGRVSYPRHWPRRSTAAKRVTLKNLRLVYQIPPPQSRGALNLLLQVEK